MAARVTSGQVKEIVTTTISEDIITTSMIDTAHEYIDTHLLTVGHTAKILEKIELYLAAHIVTVTEEVGPLRSTSLGDAAESYSTFNLGVGLASTRFGQLAIVLDSSGTLKQLGASPQLKAQLRIV